MSPRTRSLVAAAAFAVALPVAGLVVGAQAPAALSGSVLDPANRAVPNAEIILTNTQTQATQRVRSDATGRFAFVGLPPGTYAMETRLPGFATLKGTVTVTQEGVKRDLSLMIGSVQETISVIVPAASPVAPAAPPAQAASARPLPAPQPCTADAAIGGQIRPPRKLRDAKPTYPEHLRADKFAGVVVVEGVLAGDGTVKGLQIVETPHADLAQSVTEAIGRWHFEPTLLNCQPTEVKIRVNIKFAFECRERQDPRQGGPPPAQPVAAGM
jgi:TonB family protein